MLDSGNFSMHRLRRADYFGAKGFANDLMAEADSKDGQLPGEMGDDFLTDPGVVGRAGAGRDNDGVVMSGRNFVQGDLVVAHDLQRVAQVRDGLIYVVGKGIIIVDEQNHGSVPSQHLKQDFGLVVDFFIFRGRNRVGDDACAGLDRYFVAVYAEGADGDASIHVAAKIEVADSTRIGSPAFGLELIDDFHGPDFRRAADRASRETG